MEAVLLTGVQEASTCGTLDFQDSFFFFFQEERNCEDMAPFFPQLASRVGCIPVGKTRTDGLLVSLWEENKMRSETLQSG